MSDRRQKPVLVRLTGVYDANGSLAGELSYWVGARLGKRHCALCEVTHGLFREKEEWNRLATELPVPFTAVHLDEREQSVIEAGEGQIPCVVGHFDDGSAKIIAGPAEIEACEGEPRRFFELLTGACLAPTG